jgi:hypothetical protein
MYNHTCDLRCNDCELVVVLTSERPLTDKEQKELQDRMLCHACLKKKLEAKK